MIAVAKGLDDAARRKCWIDKVSAAEAEEIIAIKCAHLAGDLGLTASSLAAAIVRDMEARGIPNVPSVETVQKWLAK